MNADPEFLGCVYLRLSACIGGSERFRVCETSSVQAEAEKGREVEQALRGEPPAPTHEKSQDGDGLAQPPSGKL
jgi:hypothetical protein